MLKTTAQPCWLVGACTSLLLALLPFLLLVQHVTSCHDVLVQSRLSCFAGVAMLSAHLPILPDLNASPHSSDVPVQHSVLVFVTHTLSMTVSASFCCGRRSSVADRIDRHEF